MPAFIPLIKESNYNKFYFRKSKAYRIRALLRWFDPELEDITPRQWGFWL